jgi:SNF family Na+-dependent transporter
VKFCHGVSVKKNGATAFQLSMILHYQETELSQSMQNQAPNFTSSKFREFLIKFGLKKCDFVNSKEVYNATESLMEGVGSLNWNLVGFLAASWLIVFLILAKGIKSSGKASYVLAILPYIVLSIILGKALTLPGAMNGIKQFFTPEWKKLLEPSVWFAAVTQGEGFGYDRNETEEANINFCLFSVFFSLNVYFANVIMYRY